MTNRTKAPPRSHGSRVGKDVDVLKPYNWRELKKVVEDGLTSLPVAPRAPRRALALGGGGPAVGVSVGFLLALEEWNDACEQRRESHKRIDFPVWLGGSVGAWLAVLYHISEEQQFGSPKRAERARQWMRLFFRDASTYRLFPAPVTFTPDLPEMISAGLAHILDPRQYRDLIVPATIASAHEEMVRFLGDPKRWNPGDFNLLMLNAVMAPSPASRFLMGLIYKSEVPGLNKLWFDERYSLMQEVSSRLNHLQSPSCPEIYINAYNLAAQHLQIFSNRLDNEALDHLPALKPITAQALSAASALPYVMAPVEIDGQLHMEGALIDSFCLDTVYDLASGQNADTAINEVWISQIVDHTQIKAPTNLLEALNNLIMLYAGTTSRDDVSMFVNDYNFRQYLGHLLLSEKASRGRKARLYRPRPIEVIRLPVPRGTTHFWTHENFDLSVMNAKGACASIIRVYADGLKKDGKRTPDPGNFFPTNPVSVQPR